MDFGIPAALATYLDQLDAFIEREIKPLEEQDDNLRFLDHRREDARTDWDRGGLPNEDWEALLAEVVRRADAAGHYRYALPSEYGGRDGTNLEMAVIREHLAAKGLGLHNDLQTEPFHCRQQRRRASHAGVRQRGTAAGVDRGFGLGSARPRVCHYGSQPTARTRPIWRRRPCARKPAGESTARRPGIRGFTRRTTIWSSPAAAAARGDAEGNYGLFGANRLPRFSGRRNALDLQHADRPRPGFPPRRAGRRVGNPGKGGNGTPGRSALFQRESHSARPPRVWGPRSSVSTSRSPTRSSASRSASRWPSIRPFSSRSSSCRRSARCCAH